MDEETVLSVTIGSFRALVAVVWTLTRTNNRAALRIHSTQKIWIQPRGNRPDQRAGSLDECVRLFEVCFSDLTDCYAERGLLRRELMLLDTLSYSRLECSDGNNKLAVWEQLCVGFSGDVCDESITN